MPDEPREREDTTAADREAAPPKKAAKTATKKRAARKKAAKKAAGKRPAAKAGRTPEKTSGKSAARKAPSGEPLDERIRRRAYEIYRERGGEHGADEEDWLRAEREIRGSEAG